VFTVLREMVNGEHLIICYTCIAVSVRIMLEMHNIKVLILCGHHMIYKICKFEPVQPDLLQI